MLLATLGERVGDFEYLILFMFPLLCRAPFVGGFISLAWRLGSFHLVPLAPPCLSALLYRLLGRASSLAIVFICYLFPSSSWLPCDVVAKWACQHLEHEKAKHPALLYD